MSIDDYHEGEAFTAAGIARSNMLLDERDRYRAALERIRDEIAADLGIRAGMGTDLESRVAAIAAEALKEPTP